MTHRLLMAVGLSLSLFAGAAMAQAPQAQPEASAEARPQSPSGEPLLRVVTEEGLKAEYAARVLALMAPDLEKYVQDSMRQQLSTLGEDVPAAEANWLRKTVSELTLTHLRTVIQAYERLYAQNFTLDELSALIAFRESEAGRAISRKELAMGTEIAASQLEMQYALMMDLVTRYCQQFACEGKPGSGPAVAPKSNRH
jgi:hypothetical protein